MSAGHQPAPVSAVTWTDRAGREAATCTCGRRIQWRDGRWRYEGAVA